MCLLPRESYNSVIKGVKSWKDSFQRLGLCPWLSQSTLGSDIRWLGDGFSCVYLNGTNFFFNDNFFSEEEFNSRGVGELNHSESKK